MALLRPSVLLSSLTAFVLYLTIATTPLSAAPVSSAFTYQGQLSVKGSGNQSVKSADIRFSLFDAAAGGTQIGTTNELSFGRLPGGRFTATLDFGAGVFKGDKGDGGPHGAEGVEGGDGDGGVQGIQGLKGDKGDVGPQGAQGVQGLKGDVGLQGIQGLKGDKGDVGPQGAQGVQGLKGD